MTARDGGVVATAPPTVANLGPGFDVLGLALEGPGDVVRACRIPGDEVRILRVEGPEGTDWSDRVPLDATQNTAGVAAIHTLRAAGIRAGIGLELRKGLPIGSGLGSSAASAAAAAFAVNQLVGSPLRKAALIAPCVEAEAVVSGRHADNVAPAILGGLVLVRSVDPVDVVRLPIPHGLTMVVVTPAMELATADARAVLPATVPLSVMVRNAAQIASLVSACHSGDMSLLGRCIVDPVVTPARAALIPGASAAMAAALDAGALGSSISGAGPSVFALCRSPNSARAARAAMVAAFEQAGGGAPVVRISPADCPGVRRA